MSCHGLKELMRSKSEGLEVEPLWEAVRSCVSDEKIHRRNESFPVHQA